MDGVVLSVNCVRDLSMVAPGQRILVWYQDYAKTIRKYLAAVLVNEGGSVSLIRRSSAEPDVYYHTRISLGEVRFMQQAETESTGVLLADREHFTDIVSPGMKRPEVYQSLKKIWEGQN